MKKVIVGFYRILFSTFCLIWMHTIPCCRVESRIEGIHPSILCLLLNLFGGLSFGYGCIGVNFSLTKLYPCILKLPDSSWMIICLITSVNLGGLLGSIVTMGIAHTQSPQILIFAGCALTMFPPVLGMIALSYHSQLCSRFLTGLGVGILFTVVPAYVVDVCHPVKRGALGGLFQVSIALGIVIAALVSYVVLGDFRELSPDNFCRKILCQWNSSLVLRRKLQFVLIIPVCIAILLAATTAYIPKEQKNSQRSHGNSLDDYHWKVNSTYRGFKKYQKAVCIAIVMSVALQLTGINAIWFYTFRFFALAGLSEKKSLGVIVITLVDLSATIVAMALSDHIGRKPLLVGGLLAMSASLFAMCFTGNLPSVPGDGLNSSQKTWTGLLLLGVYLYGFNTGIGVHFWVVCNEVLPRAIAKQGFALTNVLKWIFLIIVTVFFPFMEIHFGSLVLCIFAVISACCAAFFVVYLPETKGFSKDQITNIMFPKKNPHCV